MFIRKAVPGNSDKLVSIYKKRVLTFCQNSFFMIKILFYDKISLADYIAIDNKSGLK